MSLFYPTKRGGGSRARRTFEALINLSFPKKWGGGDFRTIFTNSPKFEQFLSNLLTVINETFSYNYYFSTNYVIFFVELHIFCNITTLEGERHSHGDRVGRNNFKNFIFCHRC